MRIAVDSNVFVSALDPKDVFHKECYSVLKKVLNLEIEVLSSVFNLLEIISVLRRRTKDPSLAFTTFHNLVKLPGIIWLPINIDVAEKAALLIIETGLKAGDAIILQIAEQYDIPLLTKDKEIKRKAPKSIHVYDPLEIFK